MENSTKEISHDVAVSLWKNAVLNVETECEHQPEVIMVKGVCIGTLGNFSASTGKAKSKKTFNLSAIVAAVPCCATQPYSQKTNETSSMSIRSRVPATAKR